MLALHNRLKPVAASQFAVTLVVVCCGIVAADEPIGVAGRWKKSDLGGVHETFVIRGTGDRNNSLRRQLRDSFTGSELFVHFRFEYDARSLDAPGFGAPVRGDGEFFVLWLDASVTSASGISMVEWFGFATGKKTEPNDAIKVSDVRIANFRWTALAEPVAHETLAVKTGLFAERTTT